MKVQVYTYTCSCFVAILPSAPIGADEYCRRSLRPSVRLAVRATIPLSYQPKIWWNDAQYHGADHYLKWPFSANFCVFYGTLKFSMVGFFLTGLRDDVTILTRNLTDFRNQSELWWDDAQ